MTSSNVSRLVLDARDWHAVENVAYCNFVIIAGDKVIGDPKVSGAAGALVHTLRHYFSRPPNYRTWADSRVASPARLFQEIYQALYEDDARNDTQVADDANAYARYDISNIHPSFDRWHLFLVDCQEISYLLWRELTPVSSGDFLPGEVGYAAIANGAFAARASDLIDLAVRRL